MKNCPTLGKGLRLCCDPPHSILVLIVPHPQGLEGLKWVSYNTKSCSASLYLGSLNYLDICDLVKGGGEVLNHVGAERLDVLNLDELKHLQRNGNNNRQLMENYRFEFHKMGSFNGG